MTPREYLVIKTALNDQIDALRDQIAAAYAQVDGTLPANLRPATAADVQPGQIMWHKTGDFGPYWHIVAEVRHPDDQFKAYVADDGCRYGLHGAWVEVDA